MVLYSVIFTPIWWTFYAILKTVAYAKIDKHNRYYKHTFNNKNQFEQEIIREVESDMEFLFFIWCITSFIIIAFDIIVFIEGKNKLRYHLKYRERF